MIAAVRARLRELLDELGARRVSVVPPGGAATLGAGGLRSLPLGGGARLEVELGAIGRATDVVDRALEIAVRDLRQLARDSKAAWPNASVANHTPVQLRDRIAMYLAALAEQQGAVNVLLMMRGDVAFAVRPASELERERLPLLSRRLDAVARANGSSHGELTDEDVFGLSFWHRTALIVYFDRAYSIDFVRHRARLVARELAGLLPDLDPEPAAPAIVLPPPG
jgi:hypothetical protein